MELALVTEKLGLSKEAESAFIDAGFQILWLDANSVDSLAPDVLDNITVWLVGIDCFIDDYLFSKMKKLRCLISPTTGTNHISLKDIPEDVLFLYLESGDAVLEKVTSTAEIAWFHFLNAKRKCLNYVKDVQVKNNWNRNLYKTNQVSTSIVGIVGVGRVGRRLINYARGFGISEIIGFDPHVPGKDLRKIKMADNLNEVFDYADVVFLCPRLNPTSYNMVSTPILDNVKRNFILVNISRAEVCDFDYLCQVIGNRPDFTYCSDVMHYEENTNSQGFKEALRLFATQKNVVLTPHIGGATIDAVAITQLHLVKRYLEMRV